jgi:dTDP-4-dehydrorhamnose 3,5-epimerase
MKVFLEETGIPDLLIVRHELFRDQRGFFHEVWREDEFRNAGLDVTFVQSNHSGSVQNVVRGLHFQWEPPMGKMMRVVRGRAFLVAVDVRPGSPTVGKWFGESFEEHDGRQLYGPAGFARGFCVTSEYAEVQYLCTGVYNGASDTGILWNDAEVGIRWPVTEPVLSDRDRSAQTLQEWLGRPESARLAWSSGNREG